MTEPMRSSWRLPLGIRFILQVIYAAKLKSEEFEGTLARKDPSTTGDGKSRLALALLTVLGSAEGTTKVGQELRNIWVEARK